MEALAKKNVNVKLSGVGEFMCMNNQSEQSRRNFYYVTSVTVEEADSG